MAVVDGECGTNGSEKWEKWVTEKYKRNRDE